MPTRQRRQARHQPGLRQRALLPGQPERAVGPRADAASAQLPQVQRHGAVQHAHAADRAHRRRQPDDLHRPLRRPARAAGEQLLQDLQPRRQHRPGGLVRVLDRPGLRHRVNPDARATTPPRRWSTPRPCRPTARPTGQTPAPWVPFTRAGCTVGDFSTANMVLENTRLRSAARLRCRARPRSRSTTPTPIRSRRPRPPTTSVSACTARRATRSAPTRRASSTARRSRRRPPSRTAADRAGRLLRLPGALRRTLRRAAARRRARRSLTHNGYPVTDANGNLTDINGVTIRDPFTGAARLPRASARRRRSRWPTSPTCRRTASR